VTTNKENRSSHTEERATVQRTSYGYRVELPVEFETAVEKTIEVLKDRGFGVLTDIDVRATLKEKLDVDFRDYRILGACNPPNAYQALEAEEDIGLLLPCNVVVYDLGNGKTRIVAIDPEVAMKITDNDAVGPMARDIGEKLKRALNGLTEALSKKV
jgi:uncharacterized protein (DUF302 family)